LLQEIHDLIYFHLVRAIYYFIVHSFTFLISSFVDQAIIVLFFVLTLVPCIVLNKRKHPQKEYFTGPLGNDVFQFSPFPWVSYTHISHTNSGKKDNATPLFDWGKYFERDERWILPFSVQVHHSFVDGIHIGKLADSLQKYLNGF